MAAPDSSHAHAEVAIVTVSYGSDDVLPGFLASIPASTARPSVALVVVDNKPDVNSSIEGWVVAAGGTYLRSERNSGYGAAVNAAVAALHDEVIWILVSNPDVVLGPKSVDVLVAAGNSDEAIGAVGPAIITADGDVFPSARAIPSLRNGIGHALFSGIWPSNPWSASYYANSAPPTEVRDAGWLSGACVLVRRAAFDTLGGFDSGFFMYFEDVDLGYRLGKAGYRNVYEPAARVVHTGAHSTSTDSSRMIDAHHFSAKRFLNKKYSAPWLWPVRATVNVGLTVRSALLRRTVGH